MRERDTSGTSPIIGLILGMIIVLILSASIATFVIGLGSMVEQNADADINVDKSDNTISIIVEDFTQSDYIVLKGVEGSIINTEDNTKVNGDIYIGETKEKVILQNTPKKIEVIGVIGEKPDGAIGKVSIITEEVPETATTTKIETIKIR
jgi:FlaG/FlaF family flagellin (archaellin)